MGGRGIPGTGLHTCSWYLTLSKQTEPYDTLRVSDLERDHVKTFKIPLLVQLKTTVSNVDHGIHNFEK